MRRNIMFIVVLLIIANSLWAQQKVRLYLTDPYIRNVALPKLRETPDVTGQSYEWAVPSGHGLLLQFTDYVLPKDIAGKEFTIHLNCATTGRRFFVILINIGGKRRFEQLFYVDGQTYRPYPSPFIFVSDTLVTAAAGEAVTLVVSSPSTVSPYAAGVLWGTGVDSYIEIPGPTTTSVEESSENNAPRQFILFQNYPNPFNPETTIKYQLPRAANVKLEIFNLLGQRVATLVEKKQPAGYYAVPWNGRDISGRHVASGVYLYRLQAGDFLKVRKLTLLR